MCAITGMFRFQGRTTPAEFAAVRRMITAQTHRGPDDEGLFSHDRALLGHRRLSIVDTSHAGHQPFSSPDGSVQLVFNGEIYNFRELRGELEAASRTFVSRTDTEVLVHGYEVWGVEGLLHRLRGMFAFAIFDASPSRGGPRIVLARDRFGIKPLYYFQDPEKIVFASEMQALKAGQLIPGEIERRSLIHFLQLGSVPAPYTTQKGVHSLPAGAFMVLSDSPGQAQTYWDLAKVLEAPKEKCSHEEAVSRTRQLLKTTIEQHLISDVPLGIFLSGGIDSSALVGLASDIRPRNLVTLAISFDESAYNEAPFARQVADHYGTQHRDIPVHHADFMASLPKIFAAMDQPSLDGVNTFFISKAAHEVGLTVVLSGLGADELFSGYRHLQRSRQIDTWVRLADRIPDSLRRVLLRSFLPAAQTLFPRLSRKMWCLGDISAATPWWLARGLFSPPVIADLLGQDEGEVSQAEYVAGPPAILEELTPEGRIRYLEYQLYLQNQLLKDSDVMSMANSLELRVPFMDHELVEGVLPLPSESERSPWVPKRLLVEAMGPDFPHEVWQRPKQGFTFPMDTWMKQSGGELEAMALENTPLEKKAVQEVWKQFHAGRLHWSRPWMTVVAARFYGR
jgi:asparagine synthase (glutamine-hydrolysing)